MAKLVHGIFYLKGKVVRSCGNWSSGEGDSIDQPATRDANEEVALGEEIGPQEGKGHISHHRTPAVVVFSDSEGEMLAAVCGD